MKKLLLLLFMFACLNVSGQYTFTYTELKEGVRDAKRFIEKLIEDKDFVVVDSRINLPINLPFGDIKEDQYVTFANGYDPLKKTAHTWVYLYMFTTSSKKEPVKLRILFYNEWDYKYLTAKIKQYCKKEGLRFDFREQSYLSYYQHNDGTRFEFYKSPNGYIIIVKNYTWLDVLQID